VLKEELYIGNERVELIGSLQPNLTFNISDIKNPDKRKSDFSKSISLPSSKKINKIFEHIFEINLDLQTFNPNLKTDVLYLVNGETIIDGYLQLNEIKNIDKNITYEVTIIGRVGSFIQDLGDSYLDDLDWTSLNHAYTQAIQITSWGLSTYTYPIIDYGFNTGLVDWWVHELYPAVYAKEYIDRIFDAIGYTYTSDFLTSTPFTKLIIPYNKKEFRLTEPAINTRLFQANTPEFQTSGASDFNLPNTLLPYNASWFPYLISDKIIHTNDIIDVSNVHNTTTGIYTANFNGFYDIQVKVKLQAEFKPTAAAEIVNVQSGIGGYIEIVNVATGAVIDSLNVGITHTAQIAASSTGTTATNPTSLDLDYVETGGGLFGQLILSSTPRAGLNEYILTATNLQLFSGDQIEIRFRGSFISTNTFASLGGHKPFQGVGGTYYLGSADIKLITSTFSNRVVNSGILEGDTIQMVTAIPHEKQKDFFMGIVKMFNLYVQADTQNDKHLLIEPREDFLTSDIVDWSQKLDNSKDVTYLPMGALDSKEYLYTYKKDTDYYNELYFKTWAEVYGQEKHEITNDFVKKEFKTEVIFSPTPSVGQTYNPKILPTIKKYNETAAIGHNEIRVKSNLRILYFGGLKTGDWIHQSNLVPNIQNFTYPFASHFDDPFNPTLDLNFGMLNEIYYDNTSAPITMTDNNLFNKYHKKFIEEITDINSKIVRGYFNLNPSDIKSLSFRKQFRFNNAYFRLNKIENYNPGELTMCEFLKIKDAEVFVQTDTLINGGINGDLPLFSTSQITNGNSLSNQNVIVQGNNNYVNRSSANIQINGSDNKIFSDCNNIQISGSNNIINAGIENVVLINTNNVEVTSSNVTYINNEIIGNGSVITITTSITADILITTYEVDASAGVIVLTLPSVLDIGKVWNIKLIDATNECSIVTLGSETIDGNTDIKITQINTTISIQYDGANYIII
jgi:hypothetical protein